MKIALDTNVMVRLLVSDDEAQASAALAAVESASRVTISVSSFCEMAWVLGSRYEMPRTDIAASIRQLINAENVIVNRPAVDAGLAVLDAGGDFADGVIAFECRWLGGEVFVSFDKRAVTLMERQGIAARLLS